MSNAVWTRPTQRRMGPDGWSWTKLDSVTARWTISVRFGILHTTPAVCTSGRKVGLINQLLSSLSVTNWADQPVDVVATVCDAYCHILGSGKRVNNDCAPEVFLNLPLKYCAEENLPLKRAFTSFKTMHYRCEWKQVLFVHLRSNETTNHSQLEQTSF